MRARLALPSSGGARSFTFRMPSTSSRTLSSLAFGVTLTLIIIGIF